MVRAKKPFIALLVLTGICLSPGALLRSKIAQSVAAKMPQLIGPADSYSADVSGGLFSILRGRIDKIKVRGNGVKLSNGVKLDRLDINLSGVHFKPDQTVTNVENTDFAGTVTEHDLNDFLAKSRPDVPHAKVVLEADKLSLSASPRILAIRTPVSMEGTLQIGNETKLNLVLKRLRARGIPVPGFVRGRIMHDINPVFDTTQMGVPAKLSTVAISDGAISLTGTADVKKALAGGK